MPSPTEQRMTDLLRQVRNTLTIVHLGALLEVKGKNDRWTGLPDQIVLNIAEIDAVLGDR